MHATSIKSCIVLPPSNTQTSGKAQITFIPKQSNETETGEDGYISKIVKCFSSDHGSCLKYGKLMKKHVKWTSVNE